MSSGYPSDWNRRRHEVYERDNYTCQNCGIRGGDDTDIEIHAHHIVPKANGGTHSRSNLITLCKQCHDAVHGDMIAPTAMASSNHEDSITIDSVRRWAEAIVNNPEETDFITSDPDRMQFEHCAMCNNPDSLVVASDFSSLLEPEVLAICPDCYSIYTHTVDGWVLSYSTSDAEGIKLSGEVWNQVVEDRVSDPSALEQYQSVSEWKSKKATREVGGGLLFGGILFAAAFSIGSLPTAIVVVFLDVIVVLALVERLNKQVDQKLKDIQNTE
jgi:hypothetical protein